MPVFQRTPSAAGEGYRKKDEPLGEFGPDWLSNLRRFKQGEMNERDARTPVIKPNMPDNYDKGSTVYTPDLAGRPKSALHKMKFQP